MMLPNMATQYQLIILWAVTGLLSPLLCEGSPPNLMIILADDLGHNDIGWGNNRTKTPNLDALVADGIELMEFYSFKYCAPTRGATMTARYPFHFGFYSNQDANDYGVPTNFTMLPETLRSKAGYRTHMVGKWHLGFRHESLTPTYRGFDTFLGYYHMGEDYYSHNQASKGPCGTFLDLSNSSGTDIQPLRTASGRAGVQCGNIDKNTCRHAFAGEIMNFTTPDAATCCARCANNAHCETWNWYHKSSDDSVDAYPSTCFLESGKNGINNGSTNCDSGVGGEPPESTYSAMLFTSEIQRLMQRHVALYSDQPLFMYLPYQSVHAPEEVPSRFEAMYDGIYNDSGRKTHQAMVSALDEGVGNLTATFKELGLYTNSVMIFFSDNGGPLGSANNYPLRGGKFTNWEGGTRVRAFVHSPLLPASRRGIKISGMMHAVDIYPTFVALANITLGNTGPIAMDGIDQSAFLWNGVPSKRNVIFYSPVLEPYNPVDCTGGSFGQSCGGALRVGNLKLIVGYPGDSRRVVEPDLRQPLDNDDNNRVTTRMGKNHSVFPDGCDYVTGKGCECHHLNGGPCLFDVVEDPTESTNLASDSKYAAALSSLLKQFYEISNTGVPQAGLTGSMRSADEVMECAELNRTGAFEPYGPFIPWPHALPNLSTPAFI